MCCQDNGIVGTRAGRSQGLFQIKTGNEFVMMRMMMTTVLTLTMTMIAKLSPPASIG